MMMRVSRLIRKLMPPPNDVLERRLHKRALLYWEQAHRDNHMVMLKDFDLQKIEDDRSHGFLLDLRNREQPMFTYVGPVLQQEAGLDCHRMAYDSVPERSLLMRFASHYGRVIESGRPESAEYDFVTPARYHVLCRGALLPLSTDGAVVDHVYGAISWKSERLAASSG